MSDRGDFKVVKGYSRVASRVTEWAVGYSRVCTYSTMWRTAGGTEYWVLGSRWSVWQLENRLIQPLEMQFRQGPPKGVLRHRCHLQPKKGPPGAGTISAIATTCRDLSTIHAAFCARLGQVASGTALSRQVAGCQFRGWTGKDWTRPFVSLIRNLMLRIWSLI